MSKFKACIKYLILAVVLGVASYGIAGTELLKDDWTFVTYEDFKSTIHVEKNTTLIVEGNDEREYHFKIVIEEQEGGLTAKDGWLVWDESEDYAVKFQFIKVVDPKKERIKGEIEKLKERIKKLEEELDD